MKKKLLIRCVIIGLAFVGSVLMTVTVAKADCPPGAVPAFDGSDTCVLDPAAIPKYVTPLVIPPVMNNNGQQDKYDIAVRQFKQQILPGGIWNTVTGRSDSYPATTVWSYGPDKDQVPDSTALGGGAGIAPAPNSQFNYPAYTLETESYHPVSVRWINDLVDEHGRYLHHLLPVDQTLHWANPLKDCRMGPARTDCAGSNPEPYTGPVPIVTHVHGAHVDPDSDGYPEAWWLPKAWNIPPGYARKGTLFDDATGINPGFLGWAKYVYRNDQPATTLWYHDHALGMTRLNVYAGPAGFWLIRGGKNDMTDNVWTNYWKWDGILPGPAPVAGQAVLALNIPGDPVRDSIREIPIAIQDRSFKPNGELFYPANRAFFEGVNEADGTPPVLDIPFVPDSDIAPIWNPEAFFNTMVVNGVTWPVLEVAPAIYRFRLLDGCNSRFLNLALRKVEGPGPDGMDGTEDDDLGQEIPFYQIGAEQGFLPNVVEILTGYATPLSGDGHRPNQADRLDAPHPDQALLMALAERADVLVDFRFMKQGTVIEMTNTGPDAPFNGFPVGDDLADPETTGQVMRFVVNWKLLNYHDLFTTPPWALKLNAEDDLGTAVASRDISLNEGISEEVCVETLPDGSIVVIEGAFPNADGICPDGEEAFGPKEALLGTVDFSGTDPVGVPLKWTAVGEGVERKIHVPGGEVSVWVTENPTVGDTEEWNVYNFTADAHPIHLHLVRFKVVGRTMLDGTPIPDGSVQPWETGFKDTVIAYPDQITTLKAKFDIAGLYVWHCHIVEHEDNEMMRPYYVDPIKDHNPPHHKYPSKKSWHKKKSWHAKKKGGWFF